MKRGSTVVNLDSNFEQKMQSGAGMMRHQQSQLNHDCYENYQLVTYGKVVFDCDGCKMSGTGKRYVCKLCDGVLHMWCRYPKICEIVTHEFCGRCKFTFSEFTLMTDGDTLTEVYRRCIACREDICGFSYSCEDENLVLHPSCYKLDRFVYFDEKTFKLRAKMSSACIGCKSLDPEGWSYVSECFKYHFHVRCLVRKMQDFEMMLEQKATEMTELDQILDEEQVQMGQNEDELLLGYMLGGDESHDHTSGYAADKGIRGRIGDFIVFLFRNAVAGVTITFEWIAKTAKSFYFVVKYWIKKLIAFITGNFMNFTRAIFSRLAQNHNITTDIIRVTGNEYGYPNLTSAACMEVISLLRRLWKILHVTDCFISADMEQ